MSCDRCGRSPGWMKEVGERMLCPDCVTMLERDQLRAQLAQAQADTRTVAAILGLLPAEYLDGTPDGQPYDAADAVRRVVMDFAQAQAEAAAMREALMRALAAWKSEADEGDGILEEHVESYQFGRAVLSTTDAGRAFLERLEKAESSACTDGPVYNAGRAEGHADVAAQLRAILDPEGVQHWNLDGVIGEVRRLRDSARTWQERALEADGARERMEKVASGHIETLKLLADRYGVEGEHVRQDIRDARLAGAEEMRERCAAEADARRLPHGEADIEGDDLRALPLEPGKDGVA